MVDDGISSIAEGDSLCSWMCVACRSTLADKGVVTICNHLFCEECFAICITTKGEIHQASCPSCDRELQKDEYAYTRSHYVTGNVNYDLKLKFMNTWVQATSLLESKFLRRPKSMMHLIDKIYPWKFTWPWTRFDRTICFLGGNFSEFNCPLVRGAELSKEYSKSWDGRLERLIDRCHDEDLNPDLVLRCACCSEEINASQYINDEWVPGGLWITACGHLHCGRCYQAGRETMAFHWKNNMAMKFRIDSDSMVCQRCGRGQYGTNLVGPIDDSVLVRYCIHWSVHRLDSAMLDGNFRSKQKQYEFLHRAYRGFVPGWHGGSPS